MSRESIPISVEYIITTTSDWTKFHIVEGGWWSDVEVECLKGCDKLRVTRVIDNKIIAIDKVARNTDLVRVKAKCILNVDKKYLGSNISYLITKGDLNSTLVRIIVQGKEIKRKRNRHNIAENPENPFSFEVPTYLHVSAFQEREIKIEYKELETRVKKFKKYDRIFDFVTKYWFLPFAIGVAISFLATPQFLGRAPENWETWVFVGIAFLPWVLLTYVSGTRMNKYRVEDNEWATFYTYLILDNLERRSKTDNLGMKEDYRKEAVKKAEEFLSCIKKRWKIGRFKLARDYFGNSLSELKKNIQYRVIPSLKDGDDELLGKIKQHMRNFHVYSKNLDVESINILNKRMSDNLPSPTKIRFRDRLSDFFTAHKILKHGLFVSTLIIGCCILYYVAVSHLEILKEYAFGGSVAIFVGLLTIYFARQPRE